MKNLSIIVFLFILLTACDPMVKKMDEVEKEVETEVEFNTTPRVTGIGGIFFRSDDPSATSKWYGDNLGMAIDEYGSPIEFRNANFPEEINYLRWSPFISSDNEMAKAGQEFVINYRVYDIEGLVQKLRADGIHILDEIETYPYGKFAHIVDGDGYKVELWEPIDSFFTEMGGETTK